MRNLFSFIPRAFSLIFRKKSVKYPKYYNNINNIGISPIFILGSNRSGTSLIANIIAQHPSVEGIFNNSDKVYPKDKENNHVGAYCTSHHVWDFLSKISNDTFWDNEGVLWGHPKHISKYYRDTPKSEKESLNLLNALQFYRRTNKIPLINSHFNMFRIGLITKIFPNAKFVLIIKDFKDYIRSCSHKWTKQNINIEFPKIGLHWLTLNSCCIYDLKKYASGKYYLLDYSSLLNDSEIVNDMLNENLETIGLEKFDYDLNIISTKNRYLGDERITYLQYENFFGCIDPLLSFERKLTDES